MTVPAFAVAGWKNSGKTTLVERLVAHLTAEGFRVGTIKHSHDAFLMDIEGTDSWRHRQAGAQAVAMMGPNGFALSQSGSEPPLALVLERMESCDVVILEGGKNAALPLIEVVADPQREAIRDRNPHVFAVACDEPLGTALPVFPRDDTAGLARLALQRLALR